MKARCQWPVRRRLCCTVPTIAATPRAVLVVALLAGWLTAPAQGGIVVGTFDANRAGPANLADGPFTEGARNYVLENFPSVEIIGAPSLTPEFLSGLQVLVISSPYDEWSGIAPLSPSEQSALLDFVLAGGDALILADGYSPYLQGANSMVNPFGMNVADDGLLGQLDGTPTEPGHPVFNGPFGDVSTIVMFGAGVFDNLNPSSLILARLDALDMPTAAVFEAGVLGPDSGKVLLFSDSFPFAAPWFVDNGQLLLNTVRYLIPEPSSLALAGCGIASLMVIGVRAQRKRTPSR